MYRQEIIFLFCWNVLLKNVSQQNKTRKVSENKVPEQTTHRPSQRWITENRKSIQTSPGRGDAFVNVVSPSSKQGPETHQGPLTHRNICNYRLSFSIPLVEPPLFLWMKFTKARTWVSSQLKGLARGLLAKSVLLFPLFVLMEVPTCRLMSIINWIPQHFVISGKLYLPKKTTGNFGVDDDANIYQYVLILWSHQSFNTIRDI